jgi:hypothetical protein
MRVRCDRGSENLNSQVYQFCEENSISVKPGAAGHPQSQALVERVHRTLLLLIRTLKEDHPSLSLSERIIEARGAYLRRFHASLGMSPLEKVATENIPEIETSESEEGVESEEEDHIPVSFGFSSGDRVL